MRNLLRAHIIESSMLLQRSRRDGRRFSTKRSDWRFATRVSVEGRLTWLCFESAGKLRWPQY